MMLRGGRRRPGESKNSVRGVGSWLRHFGTVQKDFVASGWNETRLSTRRQCLLLFFIPSHVCSSVRTKLDYRSPEYSRECLALRRLGASSAPQVLAGLQGGAYLAVRLWALLSNTN